MAIQAPTICMVGSINTDVIARVPRIPVPGETLRGSQFQMGFGGKGANQAVMSARLGAKVYIVGKIGRDLFGNSQADNFTSYGIDISHLHYDDEAATGVAIINVDDNTGQNSIVIVSGANNELTPADIQASADAIKQSDVLICQLEIPLESTIEAFRIAKQNNTLTILNPAPAQPLPDELIALTDVIVPNEIEAAMLTGLPCKTPVEAEAAAHALSAKGAKRVIITLGDRGAMFLDEEGDSVHVPAEKVQAIDSTGAGDSFVGSLAFFLGANVPMAEAIRRSSAIATLSVLKKGAQSSFPSRDEVTHLLT